MALHDVVPRLQDTDSAKNVDCQLPLSPSVRSPESLSMAKVQIDEVQIDDRQRRMRENFTVVTNFPVALRCLKIRYQVSIEPKKRWTRKEILHIKYAR